MFFREYSMVIFRMLVVSLCLLLGGCSVKKPRSALRFNIVEEPSSLDPRKVRDICGITLTKMLFEGLTRIASNGRAQLALAETINESEDHLQYEITLLESKWSDGTPVTAYDFEYSWKKSLDPAFLSPYAYFLYSLTNAKAAKEGKVAINEVGVKAINNKTLIVTLEKPVPFFRELLSLPIFFPVKADLDRQEAYWAESFKHFISNGPFKFNKWKHSSIISLIKNERYWDAAAVRLRCVDFLMLDANTAFSMYQSDELDWVGSPYSDLPVDALQMLKKQKKLISKPYSATSLIRINTRRIPNLELRRALSCAIDREQIVQHILQGSQLPARGFLPPSLGSFDVLPVTSDYKADSNVKISLIYVNQGSTSVVAQAFQREWAEKLGITVNLEGLERKVYFARLNLGNYDLAYGSWIADFNDPLSFLEVFKYRDGSTNNTYWESSEYFDLLEKSALFKGNQRKKLLAAAQNVLLDDMPIIPICYLTMNYVKAEKVKGIFLSPIGHMDLKWAYIEGE